jgi:hypothetical protein
MVAAAQFILYGIFITVRESSQKPILCLWKFWQRIWEHRLQQFFSHIGILRTTIIEMFLPKGSLVGTIMVLRLCDALCRFQKVFRARYRILRLEKF